MDEKKPPAKGIKLNASQLPLSNKADFVLGADSRKVLDNKIIENLGGTGSHGYFPSTANRGYKSWSVSRELEIPSEADQAEAQMRMIEGASAAVPLQNESDHTGSDPFFMQSGEDESNPFAHEPQHAENFIDNQANFGAGSSFAHEFSDRNSQANSTEAADPALAAKLQDTVRETLPKRAPSLTPAADPDLAAKLVDTARESLPQKLPTPPAQQFHEDEPSPWSGPVTDAQAPIVVKQNVPQNVSPQWTESPWAGPVMEQQPPMGVSANMPTHTAPESSSATAPGNPAPVERDSDDGWVFVNSSSAETDVLPSWMSSMATDGTTGGDSVESPAQSGGLSSTEEGVEVELETFLNSIPDEEFVIDNETMRHLFSSLCEPKTASLKIKSAASDAADLAIAAAAAQILNTEVSIDEISIEDIATAEVMAAEPSSGADFEAIQQAYAMLDLSPLPANQRKDGSFDNVFDVVEKAAEEQIRKVEQGVPADSSSNIARTERGTIEMALHAGGRRLVPQYNFCGMLTSVEMSDGLSFIHSEEKNTWQMIEQSGKVMVSGIKSVSFDKLGNLSYVTKRGDTVTLKVDGTIDTKFAKKAVVEVTQESEGEISRESEGGVLRDSEGEVPQQEVPVVAKAAKSNESVDMDKSVEMKSTESVDLDEKAEKKSTESVYLDEKAEKKFTESAELDNKVDKKSTAKKPAKTAAKKSEEPVAKSSTSLKQSKATAKPQAKETKPAAKGSAKPKKKSR